MGQNAAYFDKASQHYTFFLKFSVKKLDLKINKTLYERIFGRGRTTGMIF